MSGAALVVRQRIAAATNQIRRVRRADRVARAVIRLGGAAVVVCVLGILVFLASEAWPLFRPARASLLSVITPAWAGTGQPAPFREGLALGVDEYQRYAYLVSPRGHLEVVSLSDGSLLSTLPLPGLGGAAVAAASRSLTGERLALGTSDGRVVLVEVRFPTSQQGPVQTDPGLELREHGQVLVDPARRPVREVSDREDDGGQQAVAALLESGEIAVWRRQGAGEGARVVLPGFGGERVTRLRLGGTEGLIAGTGAGRVYYWELGAEPRLTDVAHVGPSPITALEWLLGDASFVAGDAQGGLSAWSRARIRDEDPQPTLVRTHVFQSQRAAITALSPSARGKSFLSATADGSLVLMHLTSERTLVRLPGEGRPVVAAVLAPRDDGLLALWNDRRLARYGLAISHPEVSWRALFAPVWYEGYPRPEHVWQSGGASGASEAKLGLAPLIFGTLKATLYALIFAIPVAVLAALYTSQFAHPRLRGVVKPAVEIMAALPSVVVGFLAGLWLAPRVERHAVAVLAMGLLLPALATVGYLAWRRLPSGLASRVPAGFELALVLPLLLGAAWLTLELEPLAERLLFGGDFRLWLGSAVGLSYDPRNAVVVAIALGFAVIPIVFTISEDAFSAVPSHLTAGSLAVGATRWQTALRVVLPTASPGVFSAAMVGFGRAVGETMIVLMATGNTPVLDWSAFTGLRALSANIAVEMPEAPQGGTLYRILFLAAALLFAATFVANTVAELVRQRLRERYRSL